MGHVNDLHDHLENLIEKSPYMWNYAILWECSSQRRVLRFKAGYHRGMGKAKEVRIMGSCVSVAEHVSSAQSEWFFKISKGQSFEINEDLPGHALIALNPIWVTAPDTNPRYKWGMWERTKWAHQFDIRTFLCIPLKDKKVLELATTQIIPYNIECIVHNVDLIRHIGTLSSHDDYYLVTQQQQQYQLHQRFQQEQLHQYQLQQNQQLRLRIEEMKNRGKEKISDSKCSWTILTESSDRGTQRTFSCSHDYSGPS